METTLVLIKPGGVQRSLIGEITRRVEARGLKVDGPISRGPNHGVYFTDPFGNRLEATWSSAPQPPLENSPKAWEILEQWEKRKAAGDKAVACHHRAGQ